MMRDLIDRQAALAALGERPTVYAGSTYGLGCRNQFDTDRLAIETVPPVDAVPVVRGKWIHRPEIGFGSTWICSMCGEKTVETVMGEPRYRFCPMCGALMENSNG